MQGRLSDTAVADVALASVAATAEGASPWVLAVSAGRGGGAPFLSFHRLALGTSQVAVSLSGEYLALALTPALPIPLPIPASW